MFNVHVNKDNGVATDPHTLQVTYLGFHGDGKWGEKTQGTDEAEHR